MEKGNFHGAGDVSNIQVAALMGRPALAGCLPRREDDVRSKSPCLPPAEMPLVERSVFRIQPQRVKANERVSSHAPFAADPLRVRFVRGTSCAGRDVVPRRPRHVQRRNARRDLREERDYSLRCRAGRDGVSAPSLPNARAVISPNRGSATRSAFIATTTLENPNAPLLQPLPLLNHSPLCP